MSDTAASCHCGINTVFPDTVIDGDSDPSLCQSLAELFRLLCCLPLNGPPSAHSPDTAELSTASPFHCTLSNGPVGHTATACQLRLLTSDPGHNPRLLLRTLLDRDCHLPRILLESACKCDFFFVFVFDLFVCLTDTRRESCCDASGCAKRFCIFVSDPTWTQCAISLD